MSYIYRSKTISESAMRRLVIIPTYNEKENIAKMIARVFSLPEPFEKSEAKRS